jgi:hypothetical protein
MAGQKREARLPRNVPAIHVFGQMKTKAAGESLPFSKLRTIKLAAIVPASQPDSRKKTTPHPKPG